MDLEEQYDKIYRYCYGRLRHRELAEDVTQETFLRWLASDRSRLGGRDLRWLYTVARNLCVDEYRRRRPDPLPEDLPAPEDGSLDGLALREAVAALTEEERELILMRYANREPVSVIASVLGMSRFAVYRRTAAILEKLRERMKEDGS